MNFNEMLAKLEEGFCTRRESWPLDEGYLKLMLGMKNVWKIVIRPAVNAGNHLFSVADFKANDWVIVNNEQELEPKIEIEADPSLESAVQE